MKKLCITIGQDLSAYRTLEVPADTDLSDENLIRIASREAGDAVFDEDWSTTNALRIVSVRDEQKHVLREDLLIEPSYYNGGVDLQAFLKGHVEGLDALINGAVEAKLIAPLEWVIHQGSLTTPGGETIPFEFPARKGTTAAELDLAMMQALAQVCSIDIRLTRKRR